MVIFIDEEDGYRRWLRENPRGFVLNILRNLAPSYLMLHRATCGTITGRPTRGEHWTRDYAKVCAPRRDEIETWARTQLGKTPAACQHCLG
jgi:hypothetical protein